VISFILTLGLLLQPQPQKTQQPPASEPAAQQPPAKPDPAAPGEELRKEWEYSLTVYAYRIRDDRDYLQPTFTADRDWLHLEARYNYEDHDTGSAWVGYNFSIGDKIKLEATPMLGVVVGQTAAVAPGLKASLTWWKLELYTEYEYIVVPADHNENFSYTWSELTIAPWEWLSVGLVVQRTKVYDTEFDSQRGFLARVFIKSLEITFAYFNPTEDPVYVLGLGISF
jgi:hypothetical protein